MIHPGWGCSWRRTGSPVARSTWASRLSRHRARTRWAVEGAIPQRAASWTGPSRSPSRRLTSRLVTPGGVLARNPSATPRGHSIPSRARTDPRTTHGSQHDRDGTHRRPGAARRRGPTGNNSVGVGALHVLAPRADQVVDLMEVEQPLDIWCTRGRILPADPSESPEARSRLWCRGPTPDPVDPIGRGRTLRRAGDASPLPSGPTGTRRG